MFRKEHYFLITYDNTSYIICDNNFLNEEYNSKLTCQN